MVLWLLVVCWIGPWGNHDARYDRVTLLDGQVITGRVLEETSTRLLVRVVRMGGRVSYTRAVEKEFIAERGFIEVPQTAAPPPALAGGDGIDLDDAVAFAVRTFQEWSIRNVESASRRLLQLITQAKPADLERVDALARRGYDVSLAEFAAMVHLEYSLSRAADGHFRLYFVTPYTAQASCDLLREALQAALTHEVRCLDDDPAGGRPAVALRWLDQPSFYRGDSREASCFAKQVSRLLGMNRELARLSQALRRPREETLELNTQYVQLRALLAVVNERKDRPPRPPALP